MSDTRAQIYQGELRDGCLPPLFPAFPGGRAGFTPAAFLGQKGKA